MTTFIQTKLATPAPVPQHLAEAGFVLTPNRENIATIKAAGQQLTSGVPALVDRIPNLREFGTGPDIYGGMYIVKSEGSDACIFPQRDKPFLATLQGMIDREYARGDARRLVFALRVSRHTADAGEAHQSHIPDWHDHRSWGDNRIQSAADRLGTIFRLAGKEVAAPNGSVAQFDGPTEHKTPTTKKRTRRTFLAFMALESNKASRLLQGWEHQNPADRLLGQQPYRSYDHDRLIEHWKERGAVTVAAQRAKSRPTTTTQQFITFG